jgi:hypothetical protein
MVVWVDGVMLSAILRTLTRYSANGRKLPADDRSSSSGRPVHTSLCSPGTGEPDACNRRASRLAFRTVVRCHFLVAIPQCASGATLSVRGNTERDMMTPKYHSAQAVTYEK